MKKEMRERILAIFRMARKDQKYAQLSMEYEVLQEQFAELVERFPEGEQDIMWAFVCVSEEMNWRLLELLCERYKIKA